MEKGQVANLLNLKGMTGMKFTCRSSNNKIVSVSSKGIIKGVKSGNAVVYVNVIKGSNIYKVQIKVKVSNNVHQFTTL